MVRLEIEEQILNNVNPKIKKSKDEWRRILTPEEFHVLREKVTEKPFTGKYVNHKKEGTYVCAGCGNELFLFRYKIRFRHWLAELLDSNL
jgi:peptide-methionine (R)-S-oxide reductase